MWCDLHISYHGRGSDYLLSILTVLAASLDIILGFSDDYIVYNKLWLKICSSKIFSDMFAVIIIR